MIKINTIINNKSWYQYFKNPVGFVDRRVINLNKKFKKYRNKNFFLTLLLSGDSEIRKLNKKFRKKNKTTDVLSFPFYSKKELKKKFKNDKDIYLGDIIVNISKIKNKNNLVEFKINFNKLWVHGLVHLFGYDHKKDKDFYNMLQVEKKILSCLN